MATKGYIRYRPDYKYQLASSYKIRIPIKPRNNISGDYIDLDTKGNLLVKESYAWDGPSGRSSTPRKTCAPRWCTTHSTR